MTKPKISQGAKSMGTWVQWGVRIIGEFDLCSAKYSERVGAEKVVNMYLTQDVELVSVTVKPWTNKK